MTADGEGIGCRPRGFPGPRDTLIEAVRRELITAPKAEQLAEKLGLEPLEFKPDLSAYDPHQLAYWSLPMALAWIAYRTDHAVREVWDAYRAECRVWEACDLRSADGTMYLWSLTSLPPVKLWEYVNGGTEDDAVKRESAKRQLWQFLQETKLVAIGTDLSSYTKIEIPGHLWASLDCPASSRSRDVYRSSSSSESFEHVSIQSSDVKKLWPEHQTTSGEENQCARWLADKMRETEDPIAKDRLRGLFEAQHRRIGKNAFTRAWDKATHSEGVSDAWRKAGRRKSNLITPPK